MSSVLCGTSFLGELSAVSVVLTSFTFSLSITATKDPCELSVTDEVDMGGRASVGDLVRESSVVELDEPLVEEVAVTCTYAGEAYITDTVGCDWS